MYLIGKSAFLLSKEGLEKMKLKRNNETVATDEDLREVLLKELAAVAALLDPGGRLLP